MEIFRSKRNWYICVFCCIMWEKNDYKRNSIINRFCWFLKNERRGKKEFLDRILARQMEIGFICWLAGAYNAFIEFLNKIDFNSIKNKLTGEMLGEMLM